MALQQREGESVIDSGLQLGRSSANDYWNFLARHCRTERKEHHLPKSEICILFFIFNILFFAKPLDRLDRPGSSGWAVFDRFLTSFFVHRFL